MSGEPKNFPDLSWGDAKSKELAALLAQQERLAPLLRPLVNRLHQFFINRKEELAVESLEHLHQCIDAIQALLTRYVNKDKDTHIRQDEFEERKAIAVLDTALRVYLARRDAASFSFLTEAIEVFETKQRITEEDAARFGIRS